MLSSDGQITKPIQKSSRNNIIVYAQLYTIQSRNILYQLFQFLLVVAGTNGIPVVLFYVGSIGVIVIVVIVTMFVVLCRTLHRYRSRKRQREPGRVLSNDFDLRISDVLNDNKRQQYFNSPRKAKNGHYFRQESYEANHYDRTCVVTPVVQSSDKTDQNHSETTETLGFAVNMTPSEDTIMVESNNRKLKQCVLQNNILPHALSNVKTINDQRREETIGLDPDRTVIVSTEVDIGVEQDRTVVASTEEDIGLEQDRTVIVSTEEDTGLEQDRTWIVSTKEDTGLEQDRTWIVSTKEDTGLEQDRTWIVSDELSNKRHNDYHVPILTVTAQLKDNLYNNQYQVPRSHYQTPKCTVNVPDNVNYQTPRKIYKQIGPE